MGSKISKKSSGTSKPSETVQVKSSGTSGILMRMSVRDLEKPENKHKLNAFLRAWKRIKELAPDNPNSYWAIAGYHGEPFVTRKVPPPVIPATEPQWGGWCQHANVLFPTWHRFYVRRIEEALRTVSPEDDIAMAYWDQTSQASLELGMPDTLTRDTVTIDGKTVPNPLKDYTFPLEITGESADQYYHKPAGYVSVRYPFSGIKSPPASRIEADKHNEKVRAMPISSTELLNKNVVAWLNQGDPKPVMQAINPNSIHGQYIKCLQATNYNIFSNTSTAGASNGETALEAPHNDIHLSIGGFDLEGSSSGQIRGANGDMGENETAAFDPVFFFHHCNVDRMFWVWQKIHNATDELVINPHDPNGTNPTSGQGPTPDQTPDQPLNMDTPLAPFMSTEGWWVTSNDCINIEKQMGYSYTIGSLDDTSLAQLLEIQPPPSRFLKLMHIDRRKYKGSFVICLFYIKDGAEVFVGQHAVLGRWNMKDCRNCQHHLFTSTSFDLQQVPEEINSVDQFKVKIVFRDPESGQNVTEDVILGKGIDQPTAEIKQSVGEPEDSQQVTE